MELQALVIHCVADVCDAYKKTRMGFFNALRIVAK